MAPASGSSSRALLGGLLVTLLVTGGPSPQAAQVPNPMPVALASQGLVEAPGNSPDGSLPPILIVHGDEPKPEHFDNLVRELQKDHRVFFFVNQPSMIGAAVPAQTAATARAFAQGVTSIEDASNKVDDAIRMLVAVTGRRSLSVIAFSAGGVVTRDAMSSRSGRSSNNTLARDGSGAVQYDLFIIDSPLLGITGVKSPIGFGETLGAMFARSFSAYFGAMASPSSPVLNGKIGSNVTDFLFFSRTDTAVSLEGQFPANPDLAPPKERTFELYGGHIDAISIIANVIKITSVIRKREAERAEAERLAAAFADGSFRVAQGKLAGPDNPFPGPVPPQFLNVDAARSGARAPRVQLIVTRRIDLQAGAGGTGRIALPPSKAFRVAPTFGPVMRLAVINGAWHTAQARPDTNVPRLKAAIVSLGVSMGRAFEIELVNDSVFPVHASAFGVVLEPLDPGAGRSVRAEFEKTARGKTTNGSEADGYCLEIEREPPIRGTVFRVAPPDVQKRFQSVRTVLAAAESLERAGALTPDTDPVEHAHSIRQWAIWSRLNGFNSERFTNAVLERARKAAAADGQAWTRAVEAEVRKLLPDRWRDVQQVRREAEALERRSPRYLSAAQPRLGCATA